MHADLTCAGGSCPLGGTVRREPEALGHRTEGAFARPQRGRGVARVGEVSVGRGRVVCHYRSWAEVAWGGKFTGHVGWRNDLLKREEMNK